MGLYINIGNEGFRAARNGEYIDKSDLIEIVNDSLNSERQFMCVSRARRFGKSVAAKMLNAYYDHSCQSKDLFHDLKIAKTPTFQQYLNKYPVLYVDMTNFITRYRNSGEIVQHIQSDIVAELKEVYPNVHFGAGDDLLSVLYTIVQQAEPTKFIMIVDEWDAILRESKSEHGEAEKYVDFLRLLFKSGISLSVFAGVYMTGILPIKKYNTQSALNNFEEYTMISPGEMAASFGFTEEEVSELCKRNNVDKEQVRLWYDGYRIGDQKSIYNPLSVIRAIRRRYFESYWTNTGTYETVAHYIKMNYEGLKDDVIRLLAGESCNVNTKNFQNDLNVINSKNDVFTVLIHLGYLSFDRDTNSCYIPNKEIGIEFENAVEDTGWDVISNTIKQSEQLLQWTIDGEAERVANAIDRIHSDNTSILQYNDENSLARVLSLAYYSARNKYTIVRELPTGKGFADLVLVPRRDVDLPAIVLELKYNRSATTAISQIKNKHYTDSLMDYVGDVVLVGVNYNKRTKQHQCSIERITKMSQASGESVPSSDKKVSQARRKSVPSSNKSVLSSDAKVSQVRDKGVLSLSEKKSQVQGESVPSSGEKVSQVRGESVLSIIEISVPLSPRQRETAILVVKQLLQNEKISIPDLMQKVGATNRSRFKSKIIDSLIDAEIICPVFIDSPTNPNQKYRLTEKAKRQLGQ